MTWRKAHGAAARRGHLAVLETTPADELPPVSPADPDRTERSSDGRFAPGNRIARTAKARAGRNGALAKLEAKADPDWQAANRWGRRYAKHRMGELAKAHGGELSAGVCTIVTTAAALMADARWLRAKAAATSDVKALGLAAQLSTQARQAERDAWELASREAELRKNAPGAVPAWRAAIAEQMARDREARGSSGSD